MIYAQKRVIYAQKQMIFVQKHLTFAQKWASAAQKCDLGAQTGSCSKNYSKMLKKHVFMPIMANYCSKNSMFCSKMDVKYLLAGGKRPG